MAQAKTQKPFGPVEAGDICPSFVLADARTGKPVDVQGDDMAGYAMLFVFTGNGTRHLDALRPLADTLAWLGIPVFAVGPADIVAQAQPFRGLIDEENAVATGYAQWPQGGLVAVGANQHAIYAGTDPEAALAALKTHLNARPPVIAGPAHPPVLIVPDVLSPAECKKLIGIFTLRGLTYVEPGDGDKKQGSDYKMRVPEYGRNDRVDHYIVDRDTSSFLDRIMNRRVFPEILKAFQYRIGGREPYRIASYEGQRGGYQHGHRDNSLPHVAHRRFALSINLNTENFEGGELRFPEYGQHRYRPASGSAIVFSSSILHEPLGVTSGRRYVLLAFLSGNT